MPKAGQSMEEGTILKWHVKPGSAVKKGDVMFEIETDKANMDVEAPAAGRLARIVVSEGGTSAVLQPVAYLAENDADVDAFIAAGGGPRRERNCPGIRRPGFYIGNCCRRARASRPCRRRRASTAAA